MKNLNIIRPLVLSLFVFLFFSQQNLSAQCAGLDTLCLTTTTDTLVFPNNPDIDSYNWYTNNGATITVLPGDTMVVIDWSTSTVANASDTIFLEGTNQCSADTALLITFLEDCFPCSSGPDKDNDGVSDAIDIDDDNDGIPDSVEDCNSFVSVRPATLGLGLNGSGYNATQDISSLFGLVPGSVIVEVINGRTVGTNAWSINPTIVTEFIITGTQPVLVFGVHGAGLQNNRDGLTALDGTEYIYTGLTEPGYSNGKVGNAYFVENDGTGDGNVGSIQWYSASTVTNINFWTTNTPGSSLVNLQLKVPCDTDSDGIPDMVDVDSDNDGIPDAIEACGDITLMLEDCMLDSDGSGTYPDDDNDGCPDGLEASACANAPIDTDGDGTPDYLDLDSDGDGCADADESGSSTNPNVNDAPPLYDLPAAAVDSCGAVLDGSMVTCHVPPTISWIDSTNKEACCLLAGPDKDNDGVIDAFDSDIDNDGIPNHVECDTLRELNVSGSDLGLSPGNGQSVSNVDISSKWGLASGSVIVSVTNVNIAVNGALASNNSFSPVFTFTGTVPVKLRAHQGRTLPLNTMEGIKALDGVTYSFSSPILVPYIGHFNTGNMYYVEYTGTVDTTNLQPGPYIWKSDGFATQIEFFNTVTTNGAISLFIKPKYCKDTDFDGIPDEADVDSDNDGIPDAIEACGDITLVLEDCMLDSDGSGSYPDNDGDGCPDGLEADACTDAPIDTDGDGTPDYLDLDSDGDGCADANESGSNSNPNVNDFPGGYDIPAAAVDSCGAVLDGAMVTCHTPPTISWIDSTNNDVCCVTMGPDKDNDGIADFPDVDADNDGILDSIECLSFDYDRIRPSDFGFPMGISDGSLNAINTDLSSKWGLPSGSLVVTVLNGNSHPVTDAFASLNTGDTEFIFSGSKQVQTLVSHGSVLRAGAFEGLESLDGVEYKFLTSGLDTGILLVHNNDFYSVYNNGSNGNNSFGTFDWESVGPTLGFKSICTDSINTNVLRIFFRPYCCPDTDGDGYTDEVDLDSDNDGIPDAIEACGDITLQLEDCRLDNNGDATYPDYDGDGCPDGVVSTYCTNAPVDTDGDGTPDYLDLDSDNDGCADGVEAGSDSNPNVNTGSDYDNPAAVVDSCGLVLDGGMATCHTPDSTSWIDSTVYIACLTCDLLDTNGTQICIEIGGDPNHPLSTLDCDEGGVDNYTECENGGDPSDPSDDCDISILPGVDVCAIIAADPNNPLATADCDNGGVDNQTECDNGGDPSIPSDDCFSAIADSIDMCVIIGGDPNHPMATLDCDNGGVDNYTECENGGDPSDPVDDCDAAINGGVDICGLINSDPNHPLATLDCDEGGIDNYTECENNGEPENPTDDCDISILPGVDVCAIIAADPNNPLATADCDNGGVDNQTECDNGGDPADPLDDCYSAIADSIDMCMIIGADPTHPMATLDCDNGGVDNYTECRNGGDPTEPSDDCFVAVTAGEDLCTILAGDPNNPLGSEDCDGDGVTNGTECTDSTDPLDPCDYLDGSITLPVTADQTDCPSTCPDLSPVLTILPGNIAGLSAVEVAVEVFELNNFDTDGSAIIVRIPTDPRLVFVWNVGLTNAALVPVQNPDWNYLGAGPLVHTWQYNGPGILIAANTKSAFGFQAFYDPQSTDGQTTITATVLPFSGGECNLLNNVDSERLVYFD